MPIRSKNVSKVFKPGDVVFVNSARHKVKQAIIIKYIPHGEWYCSFKNEITGQDEKGYFNHDEID